MGERPVDDLLVDAIISGGDSAREELLAAGPRALESFRAHLDGSLVPYRPIPNNRDTAADHPRFVSASLASRFPDQFVRTFGGERWHRNMLVLLGFRYASLPEVEPLLISALGDDSQWIRMEAAISLASFRTEAARDALVAVLNDEEYLVRYHAIQSLGQIGDDAVLERLLAITRAPSNRGIEMSARGAASTLAGRLGRSIELPTNTFEPLKMMFMGPGEPPPGLSAMFGTREIATPPRRRRLFRRKSAG